MKRPRLLISLVALAIVAPVLSACGGGFAREAPTPTLSGVVIETLTAPQAPTVASAVVPAETPAVELTATETPEASTPTEVPAGVLEPLGTPIKQAPDATATTGPAAPIEFVPAELVQGGSAVVYFNEGAKAATLTFGGLQYPMLFDGSRWWAIVGVGAFAKPGGAPVTVTYYLVDGSGPKQASSSISIVHRDYPVENINLDPETSALLDPNIVNDEEALRASIFAQYTMKQLWDGRFQAPSTAPIGDEYGIARSYNGGPVTSYHRGTDFVANEGDPARAAAAGRVVFASKLQVRGNAVIIDHGMGVFTTYNHLSEIDVSKGDMVTAGQLVGLVGSTGLVTGPHLHWEVVVHGVEVDGELWLSGAINPP